jgi:hypothetical protein
MINGSLLALVRYLSAFEGKRTSASGCRTIESVRRTEFPDFSHVRASLRLCGDGKREHEKRAYWGMSGAAGKD